MLQWGVSNCINAAREEIKSDYCAAVLKTPHGLKNMQIHTFVSIKNEESTYITFTFFTHHCVSITDASEWLRGYRDTEQLWHVTGLMARLNVGHHEFFVKWMQMLLILFETTTSKRRLILGHAVFSVTWLCVCVCVCFLVSVRHYS